jgi:hypothetical protein
VASGRYEGVEVATIRVGERDIRYLRRRELPDPRDIRPLAVHHVVQGDRLDLLGTRYLGDALAAWQIADANVALDPDELTRPGSEGDTLTVPFPGGMP